MPFTVVSIEDEPEINELMSVVLESPELKVVTRHTVVDGLDAIREEHPALVIMDLMLPDMDGWTAYDTIRADPEIGQTPVILLTALRLEFQPRQNFKRDERNAYITKPFGPLELRAMIESMLNSKLW